MCKSKLDKRVKQALDEAGAMFVRKGKHNIFKFPNGQMVSISDTPSCPFAVKNQLGDIARAVRWKQPPPANNPNQRLDNVGKR